MYQKSLIILLKLVFRLKNKLLEFKHTQHKLKTIYYNRIFYVIIGVQNQLLIMFGTTLVCNQILKILNFTPTQTYF